VDSPRYIVVTVHRLVMQALDVVIQAERQKLIDDIDRLPARRSAVDRAARSVQRLAAKRSGLRESKRLLRWCESERADIASVATQDALRRFEIRVVPFIRAQSAVVEACVDNSARDRTAAFKLPGGVKRRCVGLMGAWTEQAVSVDGTVVKAFMSEFTGQPSEVSVGSTDTCGECGGRMLVIERKATLCCQDCGDSVPHIDMTSCSHAQRGEVEFVSQTYKRSNHFLEWLNQCQAKESTRASDAVLRTTMQELYRMGIRDKADITVNIVRDVLKTLKLRAQYEHACQITCRINGAPPPRFLPAIEERLRLMFLAVQAPFERVKGKRKNFLSYAYTLTQFLGLLGINIDTICNLGFAQLKGRDKLEKQNHIYQRICEQLDWQFVPLSRG
jgi:hypothetical protein